MHNVTLSSANKFRAVFGLNDNLKIVVASHQEQHQL